MPAGWLTVDGNSARMAAAVIMTPGTLLDISGVDTFALAGGADPTDAAFLSSGSGRIRVRGTTVTSYDPASNGAVDKNAAGRPYIAVSAGGRLDVTDATVSDLGTPQSGEGWHPAVAFGTGSTGTLTRATFARNSTGVRLSKSQGVALQDVTVADSYADGMILSGDRGTTMAGVHADRNGAMGVSVGGDPTDRAISGITTSENAKFGVSVAGQTNTQIHDLVMTKDKAGGLELNRATGVTVHDITTTDAAQGVFVHVFSKNVVLDRMTLTGGRTGVHIDKSTDGLKVTNSTIEKSEVAGFSIGGKHSDVTGVTVRNVLGTALKFERGAAGLTVTGLSVIGGTDGVVASGGTSGVVIKDLTTDGVGNDGVRSSSDGLQVTGGQIRAHNTGLAIEAGATVTGTAVGQTSTGVRVRTPAAVTLAGVTVEAITLGLDVDKAGAVTLRDSTVHALEAIRGPITALGVNDLTLPALNLLGAIGVPLLGIAVALELAHLARSRSVRRSVSGGRGRPAPPLLAGAR